MFEHMIFGGVIGSGITISVFTILLSKTIAKKQDKIQDLKIERDKYKYLYEISKR